MKTLYHGGDSIISVPEIREPVRTLDFGKGFYLTSSYQQAVDWVHKRLENKNISEGYVNTYDFDERAAGNAFKIKRFEKADEAWVDFVMKNRREVGFEHDYDIVIGPVANDKVYTAFALYEGGTISKDILIHELKAYRLVDQYLFHTPQSLSFLTFKTAKEITL